MVSNLSIIILCSGKLNLDLLANVKRLNAMEIFVVMPYIDIVSLLIAKLSGCKVIITQGSDRNKGYVSGLKKSKGDIFLVLDGNYNISETELKDFLESLMLSKADIILNNLNPYFHEMRTKQWPDSVSLWKQIFNDSIGFSKLNMNTLHTYPHGYTREVMNSVGLENFENLVIAHMKMLEAGWRIYDVKSVRSAFPKNINSERSNINVPLDNDEYKNTDHYLEALNFWFMIHGVRGDYLDNRRRDIVQDIKINNNLSAYATIYKGLEGKSSKYNGKQVSVIIPAQNEENTIGAVIEQARLNNPKEIIVIINGSSDRTEEIAREMGATVIAFKEPLGIDVGRAIGAREATGDIILFIDADFPISAQDQHYFCNAVMNGLDVALNDLNIDYFPLYIVNLYKYMLNIACDRKELGVCSIVAVPHAISKSCLEGIGWESLVNPCLAHVKTILQGYKVSNVHFVDVMIPNRIRPSEHFAEKGHPKAVLRIIGDHLESIAYLSNRKN